MQFQPVILAVSGADITFNPYDRGANGAFVYRQAGVTLQAPRLVISTVTDDNASDKYLVQVNAPRVKPAEEGCCSVDSLLGTDLVKTELRFLATTSQSDREKSIDTAIAALQEFRETISKREKLYS
jgi:hypothetical protein